MSLFSTKLDLFSFCYVNLYGFMPLIKLKQLKYTIDEVENSTLVCPTTLLLRSQKLS